MSQKRNYSRAGWPKRTGPNPENERRALDYDLTTLKLGQWVETAFGSGVLLKINKSSVSVWIVSRHRGGCSRCGPFKELMNQVWARNVGYVLTPAQIRAHKRRHHAPGEKIPKTLGEAKAFSWQQRKEAALLAQAERVAYYDTHPELKGPYPDKEA